MIHKFTLFSVFFLAFQFSWAQVSFQTLHKKDGTETKKQEEAYFIRIIDFPTSKADLYKVAEYYTSTDSLKLAGAYNNLSAKKFVGPKYEVFENGKLKSSEKYSHDGQLIDTAVYYYPNGKLKLAFSYLYNLDKEKKTNVIDTLVIIYRDSLGNILLIDGNGYAEIQENDNALTKGAYKNHKKDGEWTGYFRNGRYTYVENYDNGQLISGLTTDSIGQTFAYDNSNFKNSPEYPGGIDRLRQHIASNYRYPKAAILNRISGTVLISFVVEKDGTMTNVKVKRDLGFGTGDAAILALRHSKKWKAGIMRGVPVRVSYTVPVRLNIR